MISNLHILYVDDEEVNLELFQLTFSPLMHVYTALSAQEALKILEQNRIDLLATDYKMPGMNGMELIRAVKMQYPDIKCMIISGFIEYEVITEKQLIDGFVNKPWKKKDILQLINEIFPSVT